MWCGASDEFWTKAKSELSLDDEELRVRFGDDFRRVFSTYVGPDFPLSDDATFRTVFGVERTGLGYGQPTSHPLADATLDQVRRYAWPDPSWRDVSSIRTEARAYDGQYAILGGDWSPFFHDAIDLLGMENFYIKMYESPELVDAVMQHMTDYYFEVSRRIFDAAGDDIDIFFIGNDFGSQIGPLLSPDMFERFVLDHLKRLIDLGHDYSLPVMLHCCGGIEPLIGIMIDAGLDALHAVQPSCRGMDLAELKRKYGGRIVFNGGIDSHHVLIDGDVETVRRNTREVLDIMMPGGRYIAGASHDTILEETPVENVLAMFDTVRQYGVYR
jgi:uroporphyrinogen-III decarboxylase